MTRRIHWEITTNEAKQIQYANPGAELLSVTVHPEALGEAIGKFKRREIDMLVCDHTMLTGWSVEVDDPSEIEVTFGPDWGSKDSQGRRQAHNCVRVKPRPASQFF